MRTLSKRIFFVLALMMFAVGVLGLVKTQCVSGAPLKTLVWEDDVFSSGVPVTSPVLETGVSYVIVVQEIWFYDYENNLAADAMYYTTDAGDSWDWGNHYGLVGNHSFLQIDAKDVDWGPFSNGDTGHMYTIVYAGGGAAIAFSIVDWRDLNYANNVCHIHVEIYRGTTVGGYILDYDGSNVYVMWAVGVAAFGAVVAVPIVICKRKSKK